MCVPIVLYMICGYKGVCDVQKFVCGLFDKRNKNNVSFVCVGDDPRPQPQSRKAAMCFIAMCSV